MESTPNFDTSDAEMSRTTPSGSSPSSSASSSASSGTTAGQFVDDISLGRSGTPAQNGTNSHRVGDAAKRMIDTSMQKTHDAMEQLQAKASELTSKLMDNVKVDDMTKKLEQQVREHPARTLLLAVGAGFVLGKALKK